MRDVGGVCHEAGAAAQRKYVVINTPDVNLYCRTCQGMRIFRHDGDTNYISGGKKKTNCFLHYLCSNCRDEAKLYSLHIVPDSEPFSFGSVKCYKFGKCPNFADPTPRRLLRLFGRDILSF
jgi:hypothetical protein